MNHRPWPIVVIAVFHILAPVINFYFSARILGLGTTDYLSLQLKHSLFSLWTWVLLPIIAGISLLTFRLWSYYCFIAFMGLVFLYTLRQRLLYPHRVSLTLFMFLEFINITVILYFLSPQVRRIYINKRIRWWQQKPRYLIKQKAVLKTADGNVSTMVENISEGGAYVVTDKPLSENSVVQLEFEAFGNTLKLEALVIHAYKSGYGLLFRPAMFQKTLKKTLNEWKKQNVPVRGKRLSTLESFKHWARDLFKTGHGLFPDSPDQS